MPGQAPPAVPASPASAAPETPATPAAPAPAKPGDGQTNGNKAPLEAKAKAALKAGVESAKNAPRDPAQDAKIAEAVRKWKLKVNGEDREVDEAGMVEWAQKGMAAGKMAELKGKAEKAALYWQQQAKDFVSLIKKDPFAVLSHPEVGVDAYQFAEDLLWNRLQDQKLTPDQRKNKEYEQKFKEYEQEKLTQKQAADKEKHESLKGEFRQKHEQDIITALEASDLPKSEYVVKRIAEYILELKRRGFSQVKAADVLPTVRADLRQTVTSLLSNLKGEQLFEFLGEEIPKNIREFDLARIKGNGQAPTPPPARSNNEQPSEGKRKFLSTEEFRKRNERIKQGLE